MWVLLLVWSPGCGGEPKGGPRVDTFPITGEVHVDGTAAAGLQVTCIPAAGAAVPTTISGYTNESGVFSVGTYEATDGAPAGSYRLVFMWGQWNMDGRYGGPDKLSGRYQKPENSTVEVTVTPGTPNDLGVINLTSR